MTTCGAVTPSSIRAVVGDTIFRNGSIMIIAGQSIEATPASGFSFSGWSNGGSWSNTVQANQQIIAVFQPTPRTVTLHSGGWAGIRVRANGTSGETGWYSDGDEISVANGATLDVDWYETSGSTSGEYCWLMSTSSSYSGSGLDTMDITADCHIWPAVKAREVYADGAFYGANGQLISGTAHIERAYGSATSFSGYILFEPGSIGASNIYIYALTSSDTTVITTGTTSVSGNRLKIPLNFLKLGNAQITLRWNVTATDAKYINRITISNDPTVRLYRKDWPYYGRYSEASGGNLHSGSSYTDYSVSHGGSFDPLWQTTNPGSRASPYCENGVENDSSYPGGGSDVISGITADKAIYPATGPDATVTFNANGGSVSETTRHVRFGTQIGNLPVPTKSNQSFVGWYTSTTGGSRYVYTTAVDADVILYARWADPTEVADATAWRIGSRTGTVISQPLKVPKGTATEVWYVSSADLTTAAWSSSDTSKATVSAVPGDSGTNYRAADISALAVGSAGITIKWHVAEPHGNEDIMYTATLQVACVVTVTFNPNGGTCDTPSMQTDAQGKLESLPSATYGDSRFFLGWFTAVTGGSQVDATTVFQDNDIVYARWSTGYTVVYDANGGGGGPGYEISTDQSDRHTFTVPPTLPSRQDHSFIEWNDEQDGSGNGYDPGDSVTVYIAHPAIRLYAQWVGRVYTYSLYYSANGGTGAPTGFVDVESGSNPYVTVLSDTEPVRSGYRFLGWAESSSATSPTYLAGSRIELQEGSTTLYAVWSNEPEASSGTVDRVVIYRTLDGASVDVSDRLAVRSRIHEVENYGATASFTIVNDVSSASDNMLSSSFDGWSSGTGALSTGMFVRIYDDDSGYCWGTFMITTLAPAGDLIAVTCGDYIQVLRATGAEYYRNHYNADGVKTVRKEAGVASVGGDVFLDVAIPDGVALVGGDAGDVRYMAPIAKSYTITPSVSEGSTDLTTVISLGANGADDRIVGIVGLESLKVYLKGFRSTGGGTQVSYTIKLYAGVIADEILLKTWNVTASDPDDYTEFLLELDEPYDLSAYTYMTVFIHGEYTYTGSPTVFTRVDTKMVPMSDCTLMRGQTTYSGYALFCVLNTLEYKNASGTNGERAFLISTVDGITITTQNYEEYLTAGMKRAWVYYVDANANLNKVHIATEILKAPGATLTAVASDKDVNMFRCGGDCYQNYLLALADMEEDDSAHRQHAFCASPTAWKAVNLGLRYKPEDAAKRILFYAGDYPSYKPNAGGSNPPSGWAVLKSFTPVLTKSGRPTLAVAKGSRNDGTPIIVAVRDPDVQYGASATTLESAQSTTLDAAFSAYSKIIGARCTRWEGTAELSGIHSEYMERAGRSIGGIPVSIYDSRYGMSAYRAKIKECTVDYQSLVTTLVLNNYSEMYSNAILDTSKMAFSAGTFSAVATATELYTRQYVFVESSASMPSGITHMGVCFDGASTPAGSVELDTVVSMPELDAAVAVAYFPVGVPYTSTQYGVTSIQLGHMSSDVFVADATVAIPEAVRPDKNMSQYLIVNVQMTI